MGVSDGVNEMKICLKKIFCCSLKKQFLVNYSVLDFVTFTMVKKQQSLCCELLNEINEINNEI